ncbi:MAG: IS1634 family transposase [Eubacteriaceae bacterium]|nr:IS1634 family transposase [Eubacteriaceae bacterium]
MNDIGSIMLSIMKQLPQKAQNQLVPQLAISNEIDASPAGAILMGMHILEYVGFAKHIDQLLGEEHTSIEKLKKHYQDPEKSSLIPSIGVVLSLLVADMIACPRHITRAYQYEEMAEKWQTGPLLGIDPKLLNDDRIGRALTELGGDKKSMEEVLYNLVMDSSKKAGIPLNKFILDTTLLQLSGDFKEAPKIVPGRGRDSFSQLIVSLVIASGSRMPVGFGVLPGNTADSTTLPDVYNSVHRIADDGAVEFLMDRIYPTASNIRFLMDHQDERLVFWVSPLKMGLSSREVRERIQGAWEQKLWKSITYRSTREVSGKIEPPLTAFETTWILKDIIKPDLEPGQKRRPKGSIQTVEIEVRCVFYRHEVKAEHEKFRRDAEKMKLEEELNKFTLKLNQRKFRELKHCQIKLDELLKAYSNTKKFVQCTLSESESGVISLNWLWDEIALSAEKKYDGIFALLTNYKKEQVNANQLVKKYRGRDQVEVEFKDMKGILDLGKIIYQRPERIDAYIFLKIIAYFMLTFLRSYAEKAGVKTTEKKIQESMGDMLLVEGEILPLGVKTYAVARDTELNKLLRKTFDLPEPLDLIKILNEGALEQIDACVLQWYERCCEDCSITEP